MKPIRLIEGLALDVAPLQAALAANPHLWDKRTGRTENPNSPHYGLSDIWVRYAAPNRVGQPGAHESIWYADAAVLPVKPLTDAVMAHMGGTALGGVLITRIPSGAMCRPHVDTGWHASTYEKVAVQVHSAPGQKFCFSNAWLEAEPGQAYWFDNSQMHWVTNPTAHDRVTMIVCFKAGKGD